MANEVLSFSVALMTLFLGCTPGTAQQLTPTKVAEGEYAVSMEGDLGWGPIESEVFHFHETWTLWRTGAGYELEGHRKYESPRDYPHNDRFTAELAPNLQLLSVKDYTQLFFRSDSGPLTCQMLPDQLRCDSGAKDPAQAVNVHYAMDRPYGLIWPLSAFSLAGLTRAAASEKPTLVQVVQLEQISYDMPVLAVRSDGFIRYLGPSQTPITLSGTTWHPKVYELKASPVGKMMLWISPEGLLLAAERPTWLHGRMELVKFTKFADF